MATPANTDSICHITRHILRQLIKLFHPEGVELRVSEAQTLQQSCQRTTAYMDSYNKLKGGRGVQYMKNNI